jgi:hypothetical protein
MTNPKKKVKNKVEKPINIYTVETSQVSRTTYRIQANTEDEALQIAAKLWGRDKLENYNKEPSIIKIKSKNSSPNESDLEYVDNNVVYPLG